MQEKDTMTLVDRCLEQAKKNPLIANFFLALKTWYHLGLENNQTFTKKDAEHFTQKYLSMNSTHQEIYLNEMTTALQALQSITYHNPEPVCIIHKEIKNDFSMSNNSFDRLIDYLDGDSDSDY